MATGVLIMGVGKGTKQLQGFLECTKTYEATVVFGVATDTYDVLGKILRRAKYGHVTKERVELALKKFRGKVMQRPPMYSALRVQGKRLYEYAREGKEVPVEIQERPVEVKELEIVEFMDGGRHDHSWPTEEAEKETKEFTESVLHLDAAIAASQSLDDLSGTTTIKRKRPADGDDLTVMSKRPAFEHEGADPKDLTSAGPQTANRLRTEHPDSTNLNSSSEISVSSSPQSPNLDAGPPAVKLRMTVTSGFYVRSLSHDLGQAVGSVACMSELVRTRQGKFELGMNVLEYSDMNKGEAIWGPNVKRFLEAWEDDKATMIAIDEQVEEKRPNRPD